MDVFELVAKITLDSSEYESNLKGASEKTSSFGDSVKSGMATAAKVGAAAIGAATTAVVAFGGSAIKTGSQFDSAMSQVAATLGLTTSDIENNLNGAGDTFDALRQKALEMGSTTNFTAQQASEGLNILAMSGYNAEQSMSMIEDVLHLAAAGSMDMASAAGFLSGAMKGFNDEAKDSGYYADLMAKGATLANTSVSQLGEAMSSGAAGAAAYGQSADSMTVSLLRLAEQGEVGSAAGTALAAAMKNLFTPTDQAAKALQELGVSAYDSNGSARDFNAVVNDLSSALSGMSAEEANAYKQTIFGIQGLDAFNKMTVTGIDKQNEWAEALANASEGAGEAAKQYDTMTDNLQGDIDLWNSALDGFKIAISDKVMPSLREFIQFGGEGVSAITQAFQSGGLEGAVTAFGEVLSNGISMIVQLLPQAVETGSQILGAVLQGIVDNIPALMDAAVQIVTNLMNGLAENADGVVTGAITLVQTLGAGIIEAAPTLGEAAWNLVTSFGNALLENADGILNTFGIGAVKNIADGVLDNVSTLTSTATELVEEFLGYITDNAPALLESGVELVSEVVNGVLENLPELISAAGELVDSFMEFVIDNAPTLLSAGVELLTNVVSGIVDNLPQIIDAAVQVVEQLLSTLMENAPQMLSSGVELLGQLAEGLIQNIPAIITAITQGVTELVTTITNHLPEILQMGIEIIAQLAAGLIQNIPAVLAAIPQIFSSMVGTFTSQNWGSIGSNIISGIAAGIRNGVSTIINAARDAASAALNAAKSFLGIASPSKKFRDEVGKMLTKGMAKGMVSSDVLHELDAAAEKLTGESLKDLETMVKAWGAVYDDFYDSMEHNRFMLERNNGDVSQIIASYRDAQQTLHEQKQHYLAMGVDANSKAIREMEEQWWKYQGEIEDINREIADSAAQAFSDMVEAMASGYETSMNVLEHSLFLAQKHGKGAATQVNILRQLQRETHEEAEEYRRLGYSEESKEIMGLQKKWWGYDDQIKSIAESEMETWEKAAKAMQDAYDEAFNAIVKKRDAMQDKLTSYGGLFQSYEDKWAGTPYIYVNNLDKQTEKIEQYGKILEQLQERGVGGNLMNEILGLGIDEAIGFGSRLLKMSDRKFGDYLASYDRNQAAAAEIANRYYQPEFDALNGQEIGEISAAESKQLEYSEEEVSLLRRIAEVFQNSGGQRVEFKIGDRAIAEATFDDLVMVGRSRGMEIVNASVG